MKIYQKSEPPLLMRINIKKQGEKTEYITLIETNKEECKSLVERVIEKQNLSPFQKGKVTNIGIREAVGGKNGKSTSLSFKGLNPSDVKQLLIKEIESND